MDDKKEKILIADDMETFLRLEKMLLERSGYDIIMAKNGSEAIKKVQIERPRMVFLDLIMPDMNGDVVCRFIKSNKALKQIPVIMVTTKNEPEYRERCIQAGCDDYITKPVTQRDLFEKIKKFIPVERRTAARALLSVTVTTTGKSFSFADFSYDVSEGGIFVQTTSPLELDATLELVFTLPEEQLPIRAQGIVARVLGPRETPPGRQPGMGIRFTAIAAESAAKIRDYVDQRKKGP